MNVKAVARPSQTDKIQHQASDRNVPVRNLTKTQRYKLGKPALAAAMVAVDANPEFAADPAAREEDRVLAKIRAYRTWLVEHQLAPPRSGQRPAYKEVLRAIGHQTFDCEGAVKLEILALSDLLRQGDAFRHRPERAVDTLLDVFAERVASRGYGLPRREDDGNICWVATADDANCRLRDLDAISMNRLRAIDRAAAKPGCIVVSAEPPLTREGRAPTNPAARELIENAIKRLDGTMPADPLYPTEVHLAEFTDFAGVAPIDVLNSPSNTAIVQAAAAKAKMIPHPVIAKRIYTYGQLKDFGRNLRRTECQHRTSPGGAARDTARALTQFLSLSGTGDGERVPVDFAKKVVAALRDDDGRFGSGWQAEMNRWIEFNRDLRAGLPLPELFGSAMRILMTEAGITETDVRREFKDGGMKWIDGTSVPSHKTEAKLVRFAELLGVPVKSITDLIPAEWRRHLSSREDDKVRGLTRFLPSDFGAMDAAAQRELVKAKHAEVGLQNTAWARKNAQAVLDSYILDVEDFTPAMREALASIMPEEVKGPKMRRPRQRSVTDHRIATSKTEPWKPDTRLMVEGLFGAMLGYFARSSAGGVDLDVLMIDADAKGDGQFASEPGLGIPRELLHPAIFAFIDLTNLYAWWNNSRNGGTVSPVVTDVLRGVLDMMKPKTGIIWKNPGYLDHLERFLEWWDVNPPVTDHGQPMFDIEPFRQNWEEAIEAEYQQLRQDVRDLQKNHVRPLRDPFAAVSVFIEERGRLGPMGLYMVGIRTLLDTKPITTISRHVHNRDCVLALILVQTALRAKNLALKVSGTHQTLFREIDGQGDVRWRIKIPGAQFKNYRAAHFGNGRNFDFVLEDEDDLYDRLEALVTKGRPYLLAGRDSDDLFVSSQGNDFTNLMIGQTYQRITRLYFVYNEVAGTGVKGATVHGPHAVRHVVATHLVVTTGDLYVAAWALQDALSTTDKHYARFLPGDRFRIAAEALKAARDGTLKPRDLDRTKTTVQRSVHAAQSNIWRENARKSHKETQA